MNIRDFQYLVAVADSLHFGKAALACHVSQPTLSMQLKKLEDYLGVQLFERTNKRVMLTETGRDITERARRILAECDAVQSIARSVADPLAGQLRLGIFPTLAPYLLPLLMPKLHAQFPKLNLQLVEEKTAEILTRLHRGELDAALLATPIDEDGLETSVLFEEPFLLAVPPAHQLASRKSIPTKDLQNETMLLLDDGHCLREATLSFCQAIGIGESGSFRATSLETLRHMVASGNAITLMPLLATRAKSDPLTYIPFSPPAPSRTIALCWRATSARKPLYKAMSGFMRTQDFI